MPLRLLSLALLATVHATPVDRVVRDVNNECQPCQPQGATGDEPPTLGNGLDSLYTNVLDSVKDISLEKRHHLIEARDESFCCQASLDCVNVQRINVPMCYDKFTTNYRFPDGSFGSLTTGEYTSGSVNANLLTGEYEEDGEQQNIYEDDPDAKPNTATLSIPPQFTGTGVGSAIPATALGSVIVVTTTIDAQTVTGATVLPESTIIATVEGQTTALATVPERTFTAPTTIAPVSTEVTATPSVAAEPSETTGAAPHVAVDSSMSLGMTLFSVFMYAIYAV